MHIRYNTNLLHAPLLHAPLLHEQIFAYVRGLAVNNQAAAIALTLPWWNHSPAMVLINAFESRNHMMICFIGVVKCFGQGFFGTNWTESLESDCGVELHKEVTLAVLGQ